MSLDIKTLDLIDVELESSFLVLGRNMGIRVWVPTFGYLILGGDDPILVDTGASHPEIMERLGMLGRISDEQKLENQLGKHGVAIDDVRYILHTHLHIDHAGQDNRFPMSTTVVINRKELEFSVSGMMGEQYPAEYIKHLVDRLHTPGALRLLDLDVIDEEIAPGVVCTAAGGHTEGSMNILVETAEGIACICGDVIYDIQNQIVEPIYQVLDYEPQTTGNHSNTKRAEKAAIKKALNAGSFVLPIHDYPARVERGRVVARLKDSVPGPETPVEHRLVSESGIVAGIALPV
jgi:glyoxylase-like metal-dependent hydrolase (beta-lactamase superfamily II)